MLFFCYKHYIFFSLYFCSYKILQSSDYDDTRLITGENLRRQRATKLAHLSLKHISLLGVVRMKVKKKKSKKKKPRAAPRPSANHFLFDEAAAAENYDSEDEEDDDEDDEDDAGDGYDEEGELLERGLSESEEDSDSSASEDEEEDKSGGGDLTEQIVRLAEREQQQQQQQQEEEMLVDESSQSSTTLSVVSSSSTISTACSVTSGEHNYALEPRREPRPAGSRKVPRERALLGRKRARYRYSFLYSMVVSGAGKLIKNCIPRGVAVLSNSKTIILSHVNTMLECLDPRKAEICYMDTDSCIFSLTHENLEDNLLTEKIDHWNSLDIIADESGDKSCHGKMKLEGTFKVGLFKALKIYRLFSSVDFEREKKEKTCYTRCKGVNRNIATLIPNKVFDQESLNQVVVHRSCLRPSRTGEMIIAHECKSLAAPFNFKRHVTSDGLHTFPISYFPDLPENGNAGDLL